MNERVNPAIYLKCWSEHDEKMQGTNVEVGQFKAMVSFVAIMWSVEATYTETL